MPLVKRQRKMVNKDKEATKDLYLKKVKKGPKYKLVDSKETKSNPREPQRSNGTRTLCGYRKT